MLILHKSTPSQSDGTNIKVKYYGCSDPGDVVSCVSDQEFLTMSSSIWPSTTLENFLADIRVKLRNFLYATLQEVR